MQGTTLLVAENLTFEGHPHITGSGVRKHDRVQQIIGDGAIDPCYHGTIHMVPIGLTGVVVVRKHMIREVVLAEDDEEKALPLFHSWMQQDQGLQAQGS